MKGRKEGKEGKGRDGVEEDLRVKNCFPLIEMSTFDELKYKNMRAVENLTYFLSCQGLRKREKEREIDR